MTKDTERRGLVIERIFDAPVEKVWKAWTDRAEVKKWWGPRIFTAPTVNMDFRVGGKYLFCMQSATGEAAWQKGIWSTGTYKEIVPLKKIVSTDSFADAEGNVVPASHYGMNKAFPMEMLVTVEFEQLDGNKTKMTLTHVGMPAGEDTKGANAGWNESFDKLAEALT